MLFVWDCVYAHFVTGSCDRSRLVKVCLFVIYLFFSIYYIKLQIQSLLYQMYDESDESSDEYGGGQSYRFVFIYLSFFII